MKLVYLPALLILALISACSNSLINADKAVSNPIGSLEWQIELDKKVQSADAKGHGPDIGSAEWCQSIEHKLFKSKSGLKPCSPTWNKKVNTLLTASAHL
ncbi:hypothetical protein AwWohl_02100 [Gammaproteobacteria bacterium]|nr:hypothetical protein AwWohl_02100 [Gammaproteobacteria bacterium]